MRVEPVPPAIRTLERPHPALWKYYILTAIATGPGIFITLPMLYFRYHTLRYRFDDEGIHMKVGILFRREVNLTYSRIQDIHLHSNFVQRWLGLANVQIQTASGSASPELVIEGFPQFEQIRDFLYTRMRGYKGASPAVAAAAPAGGAGTTDTDAVSLLLSIRDELRLTREALERRGRTSSPPPPPVTIV